MEIAIAAYLATVVAAYVSGTCFDKAYDAKIKRLGYIYTSPKLYGDEAKLENVMNKIKEILICMIPLLNLVPICTLFGFGSFSDSVIKSERDAGNIRKASDEELKKAEQPYLQRRIEELKKFQTEIGKKNVPRTYSELTYDEKINILLHELELAYQEKAEAEGLDMSGIESVLDPAPSEDKEKGLKKTLEVH